MKIIESGRLPDYWQAKKPGYWRRAANHDYSGRHIYFVTLVKALKLPPLCALTSSYDGGAENAWCRDMSGGVAVKEAMRVLRSEIPAVRIMESIVMPDHVHMMVYFTESDVMSLGDWISIFKTRVNRLYYERQGDLPAPVAVFVRNFHDRIIRDRRHLETELAYLRDNPRRLWIRSHSPGYFRICGRVRVCGRVYVLYGNPLILDMPEKEAVKVSRRHSGAERAANRERWLAGASRDVVLVSPSQ